MIEKKSKLGRTVLKIGLYRKIKSSSFFQKNKITFFRIFCISLLAILIFLLLDKDEYEVKIKEFNASFQFDPQNIFQQEHSLIKIEPIEVILSKILERQKYNKICFRDEGSYISEEAFSDSVLIINVTYDGYSKILLQNQTTCFKLTGESNQRWNFSFSSPNELTQAFFDVKEFGELMVSPSLSTYLRINSFYVVYVFAFCLFYSGTFLWVLNGILVFIKNKEK